MSRAEPRIVGRYAVYGEIASGGMATVHFARLAGPPGSARTVAVKRAHPHLAREPDFALMFLDEARVASRIRHPNVVPTLEVVSTPDDLALVMDYVHGESLWRLVRAVKEKGERVPLSIAAAILIDTLHGLHAAHEATDEEGQPLNIVHRDVSPQNILVGADGVARLVDFGIAKAAGRLHSTRDSTVKGKYAYMAPEQIRGEPVSRLTDTYAAAIVFWELLTGERLFVGKTEAETIHKALVARVHPPSRFVPELDPRLDEILRRALSREPAGRYPTARDLALDIEAAVPVAGAVDVAVWVERIAGDALTARAEAIWAIERDEASGSPAPAPTSAPARSRRMLVLSALLVAVVAVVGAVAMRVQGKAPAAPPVEATTAAPITNASTAASAPPSLTATPPASSSPAPPAAASESTSATVTHPPARTSPRSAHPRRSACDPPYSIDSQGRQIFKPECM